MFHAYSIIFILNKFPMNYELFLRLEYAEREPDLFSLDPKLATEGRYQFKTSSKNN